MFSSNARVFPAAAPAEIPDGIRLNKSRERTVHVSEMRSDANGTMQFNTYEPSINRGYYRQRTITIIPYHMLDYLLRICPTVSAFQVKKKIVKSIFENALTKSSREILARSAAIMKKGRAERTKWEAQIMKRRASIKRFLCRIYVKVGLNLYGNSENEEKIEEMLMFDETSGSREARAPPPSFDDTVKVNDCGDNEEYVEWEEPVAEPVSCFGEPFVPSAGAGADASIDIPWWICGGSAPKTTVLPESCVRNIVQVYHMASPSFSLVVAPKRPSFLERWFGYSSESRSSMEMF